MSACYHTSTPINQSIPNASHRNPLAELLKVALNPKLSAEARLLYVILCLMAWSKGYCWPSQQYQAEGLGRSTRQVRRYQHELEQAGLLRVEHPPGKSNRYHPSILSATPDTGDHPTPDSGVPLTLKTRTNKQIVKNVRPLPPTPTPPKPNVNALSPLPLQRKTFPAMTLVQEIELVTGDTWSRGGFRDIVSTFDDQLVRTALSITRDKLAQESGVNAGAYFTSTVRGLAGIQPFQTSPPAQPPVIKQDSRPVAPLGPALRFEEKDDPPKPEDIIKGLRLHWRNEGLSGLLTWTEKSVVGINTREIWAQVKEFLPQARETERIDRFLETLKVRIKHQQARSAQRG
jgi:hypothetical protein